MTLLRSPSVPDWEDLPLFTRKKRAIPNEHGHPQRMLEAMDAAYDNFRELPFGARIRRRSADSTYNCCGMVFANRRTAIDPQDLSIVYADEYRTIDPSLALEGDVVVYRDQEGEITHVGIILSRKILTPVNDDEFLILSQWGWWGEYVHASRDVPQSFGSLNEIWTERP